MSTLLTTATNFRSWLTEPIEPGTTNITRGQFTDVDAFDTFISELGTSKHYYLAFDNQTEIIVLKVSSDGTDLIIEDDFDETLNGCVYPAEEVTPVIVDGDCDDYSTISFGANTKIVICNDGVFASSTGASLLSYILDNITHPEHSDSVSTCADVAACITAYTHKETWASDDRIMVKQPDGSLVWKPVSGLCGLLP